MQVIFRKIWNVSFDISSVVEDFMNDEKEKGTLVNFKCGKEYLRMFVDRESEPRINDLLDYIFRMFKEKAEYRGFATFKDK